VLNTRKGHPSSVEHSRISRVQCGTSVARLKGTGATTGEVSPLVLTAWSLTSL
jgi:hypothetical protein